MPASFALCSECLAKYRALRLDTEARCSLNIMPLGTLVWSDEHPQDATGATRVIVARGAHAECGHSILRLSHARTRLWRTGVVPEDRREIWEEAQRVLPEWPGFQRLTLSADQQTSLEACDREAGDVWGLIAREFPNVTVTDRGGGVAHVSAVRAVPPEPQQPPAWSRWLERVADVIGPIVIGLVLVLVCLSLLDYFGVFR